MWWGRSARGAVVLGVVGSWWIRLGPFGVWWGRSTCGGVVLGVAGSWRMMLGPFGCGEVVLRAVGS